MSTNHLVLAGGGHTHALILNRWIMRPDLRPKGLITLINRSSTNIYSSMVPGLVSGIYKYDQVLIDLRTLCHKAGIAFICAEIIDICISENTLLLENRESIRFDLLSLDVGSEKLDAKNYSKIKLSEKIFPIKPLNKAIDFIEDQDNSDTVNQQSAFTIVGAGLSGIELAIALRNRWKNRPLRLMVNLGKPNSKLKKLLEDYKIECILNKDYIKGPALLCTGCHPPNWLTKSGLPVDENGRILTRSNFQVIDSPNIFAAGDCAVIQDNIRPPSGVWAVRAAKPLAMNLERHIRRLDLLDWRPGKFSLQLIGGVDPFFNKYIGIAIFAGFIIGPNYYLGKLKRIIDQGFIDKFSFKRQMFIQKKELSIDMFCRGCAAKISAEILKNSLNSSGLSALASNSEDAAMVAKAQSGETFYQSVDGFPALVSDPWINARITTLHACSDLWASGLSVDSAHAIITLPFEPKEIQQKLLEQSLAGINSALNQQNAKLIGGHTLESRSVSPQPSSLGLQVSLSVNGSLPCEDSFWNKHGLQLGDTLCISRSLGSGVLFAAAMVGKARAKDIDLLMTELNTSQHEIFENLRAINRGLESQLVHACTDITGFGLLGHLGEMLFATNSSRSRQGLASVRIKLFAESIPSYSGALGLFQEGFFSTLAPENRSFLRLLDSDGNNHPSIELVNTISAGSKDHQSILDLIVDPQTCGPLVVACPFDLVENLTSISPWKAIGEVVSI